jgi:hypothetical protein
MFQPAGRNQYLSISRLSSSFVNTSEEAANDYQQPHWPQSNAIDEEVAQNYSKADLQPASFASRQAPINLESLLISNQTQQRISTLARQISRGRD